MERVGLKRMILALTVLGLSACSLIETGYQQSPWLVQWWLGKQLDLDGAQSQALRADLRSLLAWHRQNQLPQINRSVQGLIEWTSSDLTPAQACAFQDEVLQSLTTLSQQAAARLSRTALGLRAEQIEHLRRYHEDENRSWREEWLEGSAQDRLQRRMKRALERIEDYYGSLDASQKKLLRQILSESPYHPPTAWAERQRRQRDMADTLERVRLNQPSAPQAQQAIQDLIGRMIQPPIEAHRQHVVDNAQFLCTATARVHNAMRSDQRERARAKLEKQHQALMRLMTDKD